MLASSLLAATAWAAGNPCEVRSRPSTSFNAAAGTLQRYASDSGLAGGEAPAAVFPGGEPGTGRPEPSAETLLGAQYGGEWYEDGTPTYYIGLTAGAVTLADATAEVDGAIRAHLGSSEAAFLEGHTTVLPVPYSPAQLQADQARLQAELAGAPSDGVLSIGQGVGEAAGGGEDYWPQVQVVLGAGATEADCEAVLALIGPYDGAASLIRTEEREPIADGGVEPVVAHPVRGHAEKRRLLHLSGRVVAGVLHLKLLMPARTSGAIRITVSPRGRHRMARILRTVQAEDREVVQLALRLPRADRAAGLVMLQVDASVPASGLSGSVDVPAR